MSQKQLRIGGHLTSVDGLRYTIAAARALGYNVVQTMLGEGRDYTPRTIHPEDATKYRTMAFEMDLYVHLPYIINPCEEQKRKNAFYQHTFREYAKVAFELGTRALVLHPGYKKALTRVDAYRNCLKFLENIMDESWNMDLLIETDSGSKNGSAIGDLDFIRSLIEDLDNSRIAMCLDTEHLFARGITLWDDIVRKEVLDEYGHHIRLVHLNCPDLNVKFGGFLDRHNVAFEEREDLDSDNMVRELVKRFPCVLERRSVSVQKTDMEYIQRLLEEEV